VMFFIERINQILAFVEAIINSVYKIATGDVSTAAKWIENALAKAIPIIISFLARFLSLTGIAEKIKEAIKKIQDTVEKAVDKLIDKVVKGIGKLFGTVTGKDGKPDERTPEQKQQDLDKGVAEAEQLLEDEKKSPEQVKKQLVTIKSKYKMTTLELVTDNKSDSEETDHIHGEINPGKDGPRVKKKASGQDSDSAVTESELKNIALSLEDRWLQAGGKRHFRNKAGGHVWIRLKEPTKENANFGATASLRSGGGGGQPFADEVNKELRAKKLVGGIRVPVSGPGGINYHTETMIANIAKGIKSNNSEKIKQVDIKIFSFFEVCSTCQGELNSTMASGGKPPEVWSQGAQTGIEMDDRYPPPGFVKKDNPNYGRTKRLFESAQSAKVWFKSFDIES